MGMNLHGRALDVACARALGWTPASETPGLRADYRNWLEPSGGSVHRIRRYSEDRGTLGEKMWWLRIRGHVVQAVFWLDGSVSLKLLPDDVHGKDIDEATARLVVAVAQNGSG